MKTCLVSVSESVRKMSALHGESCFLVVTFTFVSRHSSQSFLMAFAVPKSLFNSFSISFFTPREFPESLAFNKFRGALCAVVLKPAKPFLVAFSQPAEVIGMPPYAHQRPADGRELPCQDSPMTVQINLVGHVPSSCLSPPQDVQTLFQCGLGEVGLAPPPWGLL